jgi:hypothetical protein
MKTIFSFLFAAIFILSALSSRAANKIGIRAGYQIASLRVDGSKLLDTGNLNGFYVGLFRENKLIPLLNLGYGLDYLQNGAEDATNNQCIINYLSVPLYLKAKVGPVFGLAGIGANFKLGTNSTSNTISSDYVKKSFDMPLFIGGGFKILMFSIEGRYNWGLIELNKASGVKNQYFQLGATVSF